MAPVKEEDDPVIAEYDVYLTPPLAEHIYLLQYPNRPRYRGYNSQYGATPEHMRIKPHSGYMEMDIKLSTEHNFNKYMGLKWGDATKASKELHNISGTYGPAAGLVPAKARGLQRGTLKDNAQRDLDLENDLQSFKEAEKDKKVHDIQTLGGQIIRHHAETEAGKPYYFVGAFQGDKLHLTKITGTVQMRPNFHHLDAEEERSRIASSRAQADAAMAVTQPVAQSLKQNQISNEDTKSVEYKLKAVMGAAAMERWIPMEYVDDESDRAYRAFEEKLKVRDVENAPHLKSQLDNDGYLDAISAPRHDSPTRRRKRASRKKETVELEDDEDEQMADVDAEAGAAAG
ncbi:DNA-directed RNA polymerase III subunit rpc5 [Pseudocercospora fuligena]|uniref:DNA-directed RNA polymerase III subunit rpc5 n=1 Tax=Pseudocercospora fuligena TaxID=685502 RepID=A0A8H6RPN7_9PEZI|nr:DNA-directed RNA polymerase III subunit rpc5 [Pseudocercospora fuligena]